MREYRNELRLRTLALRGNADPDTLEDEREVAFLDAAIIRIAGKVLSNQELIVFYLLYGRLESWGDVWDGYNGATGGKVNLEAVQRAARRAVAKIRDAAPRAKELRRWDGPAP